MNTEKINIREFLLTVIKLIFIISVLSVTIKFARPLTSFIAVNSYGLLSGKYFSHEEIKAHNTSSVLQPADLQNNKAEEISSNDITEEPEKTTEYAYSTPDDIKIIEENYLAAVAEASVGGQVQEVFFRASGSTHFVDGIYIKNTTATKNPDFSALIKEGPVLEINDKSAPTVLIFHTHTTESYLLSDTGEFYENYETRSFDEAINMVRIGEEICRVLEAEGIGYIHDKNIYDETYNGAYSRSRISVEKYLEEYPTIKIVLDVHRDAIYYSDTSHCKPTAEINGKKAAQIMIITGAEEGYITDFPHWEDNLRFALCLQKTAEEMYPGLMKPLYFCQRKYNMDTAGCSLLLEVGADANTLDEALYSAFMTGNVLSRIIRNAERK